MRDVIVENDIGVPMSDGTVLVADVWRPSESGRFPVLIERTPYGPESPERIVGAGEYMARQGYVVVIQDVRGRFRSEGEFYPFTAEGWGSKKDGHDTIEWASDQPWSNGMVATIGGSYSGVTQYLTAPTRPPHLVCQVAREAPSNFFHQWVYRGGAFELAFNLQWTLKHSSSQHQRVSTQARDVLRRMSAAVENDLDQWFAHLPLTPLPPLQGYGEWYEDFLDHAVDGPYWDQWDFSKNHHQVDTPIFHIGGWYDIFLQGTLENYTGIRAKGATDETRSSQRLLVGPWVHGAEQIQDPRVGEVNFGLDAVLDPLELRLRWLEYWLKGRQNGVLDEPPVRVFTMGINRWRDFDDWPPPGTRQKRWYLRGGVSRSADSLNDGCLTRRPPDADESPDSFTYDPGDPVPTHGGNTLGIPSGPMDQRHVERRCLTFSTDPLDSDLEVTGPVTATLYASSSAPDTDWVVRLTDVHPDGRSMTVCDGILRGRFRHSWDSPRLLDGTVDEFQVDLWGTSHVFRKGHRIRVTVTSSCFPRWDRNLNTGRANATGGSGIEAINTVFHDALRPSFVSLPVSGSEF